MSGVLNDSEIIALYFSRDENAIAQTDKKYGKLFRHISINILNSAEDAEECVNDAYLKLWNAIPPESPESLMAYGAKAVRNISLNRAEFNNAGKRKLNELCTELSEAIPDSGNEAADSEFRQLLNAFLKGLSQDARVMFVLRYFHGEQTETIANIMNISHAKVRSQLFRTRNSLRDFLKKEGISI